jgi:hypothetical protein
VREHGREGVREEGERPEAGDGGEPEAEAGVDREGEVINFDVFHYRMCNWCGKEYDKRDRRNTSGIWKMYCSEACIENAQRTAQNHGYDMAKARRFASGDGKRHTQRGVFRKRK